MTTVKITWTLTCCGRRYTVRRGMTIRCYRCGRIYRF